MVSTRHGQDRKFLDLLAAVVAALVAFTAVPAVLALVVGNPLGGGVGHTWEPSSRDALCIVVVAAWVAWVACCAQLLRSIVGQVRRGAPATAASASLIDRLAGRIAVGVLTLGSFGGPLALASGAGAVTSPAGSVGLHSVPAATTEAPGSSAVRDTRPAHIVRAGDTLWSIGQERLEDGADWTALAALNLGRPMGNGLHFVDPDHLRAGWNLSLPAIDLASTVHSRVEPRATPHGAAMSPRRPLDARLPELAVLGLGSLTCAALARRARARRDRARLFVDEEPLRHDALGDRADEAALSLSPEAIDAGTLLTRFEDVPALPAFEAANILLGAACHPDDGSGPHVRTVCIGPDGVTFWLRSPVLQAPPGFVALDGGGAWRVGHDRLTSVRPAEPYLAVALPIGSDHDGTWLVTLGAGDVLSLLGSSAHALSRAARIAQESWAWADRVIVTEQADDPRLRAIAAGRSTSAEQDVLFFGDHASLAPSLARRVSIVTTSAVGATDLSILVDPRAATIHPIGRVVRPHLLEEPTARAVEEFVAGTSRQSPPNAVTGTLASEAREATPPRPQPGTVEVRLLATTPRIDGLVEPLPPNRARRAVELVAYLSLHHPDVVTSDRLRTRVLGSSDADAAAKTLFNTAYAARRAMGLDAEGEPLFPAASRNGFYRLAPEVTVDVQRAIDLVEMGKASASEDVAIASYCAALNLVEGEPLANALAGYTWWEAEGHAGRVSAALVDAACALAAVAPEHGLTNLARWGLEQARLVAPYSEALSRAAMELAAAEGDADRLRLEWRSCQRMVDTLDPGATPSPRTESLYGELSRRVLVPSLTDAAGDDAPARSDCTSAADA